VKPRLFLDEDITPLLARLLRERGHDVVSCRDIGATGITDEEQLERATGLGRAILSSNYGDFIRISRACVRDGRAHGGIIISYHQIDIDEISDAVELVARLMTEIDGERLPNCLYRLEDFR
jgi:predicted nuclease of predicted toxin-antitoxin system